MNKIMQLKKFGYYNLFNSFKSLDMNIIYLILVENYIAALDEVNKAESELFKAWAVNIQV